MCNANIICSFCWYLGGDIYTNRAWLFAMPSYTFAWLVHFRGCSCPRSALPLARARTAPTELLALLLGWCTIGGCSCPNCTNRAIGTTAWLVHLRQVHPLKDYLTSTFFTLPSAERTMFRPFWSLESLTPSTVKSVAAPSATVVALMPVSGSEAFSPNTKLAS